MTILIGTAISISASAQTARVDDRSPEIQKLNPAVSPPVTIGNPVTVSTNTPAPAAKPAVTQYDSKTVRQPANKPAVRYQQQVLKKRAERQLNLWRNQVLTNQQKRSNYILQLLV